MSQSLNPLSGWASIFDAANTSPATSCSAPGKISKTDWEGEHCFPVRETPPDETYGLSDPYRQLFYRTYDFCSEIARTGEGLGGWKRRVRYWGALALLRCVMSSPAAAIAALDARQDKLPQEAERPSVHSYPSLPKTVLTMNLPHRPSKLLNQRSGILSDAGCKSLCG
jgi:hypothetical protein